MSKTFKIHSSIIGATAIKAVGEVLVASKWKETKNQKSMERAVLIPMECVKAPDCNEAFRALVESALMATAESVLKDYCTAQPNNFEVLTTEFDRPQLIERFISGANSGWMTADELEAAFKASATWARISSREEFKTNRTYQAAAERYKDAILKLSGKATRYEDEKIDAIISKLAEDDLESELGAFVLRRLDAMKKKNAEATVEGFDAL